ncbi:hypothetical protein [Prosthecobacter sp.]|uniref:hypothetical protein n=1 Tax=Prosthecobacter sp. TaxID=1965333 RepID=UPI0037851025
MNDPAAELEHEPVRHCPGCEVILTHPCSIICHACWQGLPQTLRHAFVHTTSIYDRWDAYNAIVDHFREKKENPELFPV